jgi:C-terminal processing protease CtpA/Prc
MREVLRKENGMIRKLEILGGNVGYMRIDGFLSADMVREPMTAAFAFLKNTDALIIDTRFNGGGDPNSVALLTSFLSEGAPYLVNSFHHREGGRIEQFRTTDLGAAAYGAQRPVYVLTSRRTFSGGEEFAYDIKAFKRGVVVGETTGGGANPTRGVELGHGFFASIPFGRAVNPVTGTNWEGVGVSPDLAVAAEQALSLAHQAALDGLKGLAHTAPQCANSN